MPEPKITLYIRHHRQDQGRTLVEVATKVGRSTTYLHRAELGQGDLSLYVLQGLADALQVAPWHLAEFVGWPVPTPCTCPCHATREGTA